MLGFICANLAILAYTYAGYPVLIALAARFFPLELAPDDDYLPVVSTVIPAYNAAAFIEPKVKSLLELDYPRDKLEILIASDGSTDETNEILRRLSASDSRIRPLWLEKRSGKPNAVNAMRKEATGEVLLMTDIRQPLVPGSLRALVRALSDPSVGCASGNLVLRGATGAGFYWRYENAIRRAEGRFRSMVGVTGPIYAIRKADMDELPDDVILDDMWVPMRLRLAGRRIVFVEEAEAYDQAFLDEREWGRKVRTLAGNYQLFARLPRLLLPFTNPSWFETFSHKILRLVCPWVMLALLLTSIAAVAIPASVPDAAGQWLVRAVLAGQLLFYAGALAGARAGKLGGIARTFVVLNYAAVVGLFRYLRGRQRITW